MHELKITGETPEALYMNVVNTLAMFLRGPAQTTPVEPGKDAAAAGADTEQSGKEGSSPSATDQPPPKAKRGKKADAEPAKVETLNDPLPASMTDEPAKELTLAGDIIPRLMAIQAAHTKRGNDMPTCVKFIQKLYGPFGIANAKNLKPEQFAEFMEASEAYLTGEA